MLGGAAEPEELAKEMRRRSAPPQAAKPGEEIALRDWKLSFAYDVSGWPLPDDRKGDVLGDWTRFGAREAKFDGAAVYSAKFDGAAAGDLELDLGEVHSSASVRVNGRHVRTVFMHPYKLEIPRALVRDGENTLEIEVANLGANRIRAYDRKGVKWKIFENANIMKFAFGRLLHAEDWPILPSGLEGPVRLSRPRD